MSNIYYCETHGIYQPLTSHGKGQCPDCIITTARLATSAVTTPAVDSFNEAEAENRAMEMTALPNGSPLVVGFVAGAKWKHKQFQARTVFPTDERPGHYTLSNENFNAFAEDLDRDTAPAVTTHAGCETTEYLLKDRLVRVTKERDAYLQALVKIAKNREHYSSCSAPDSYGMQDVLDTAEAALAQYDKSGGVES